MLIYNLTQHDATEEQLKHGVIDLPIGLKIQIKQLLTFNDLPSSIELNSRAVTIANLINVHIYSEYKAVEQLAYELGKHSVIKTLTNTYKHPCVMIGGAPYFMPYLEKALKELYITPVYAFSKRVSVETINETGEVIKTNVFKHEGFILP